MNTLEHFASLESDLLRGDPKEGDVWWLQSHEAILSIKNEKQEFVPIGGLIGTIRYSHPDDRKKNIFCMYGLKEEVETEGIDKGVLDFGDTFVILTNPDAFLERLVTAGKAIGQIVKYGLVEYIEEESHTGLVGPFRKTKDFSYQSEFRIVVEPGVGTPLRLEIGDIRDITLWGLSSELEQRLRFTYI